ncbi:uncharacterized protein LOC105695521 isoform X2 [Orussus abietinus]|uniref:uncharacterized protein LOC105695521 isoform X2 n=1 Tax=Orussus abietinus TaxID=222816 RepID=UPI000626B9F3|nr:uncharacterized protein LOC105695521 isoform X2 [Orussus abietinus]
MASQDQSICSFLWQGEFKKIYVIDSRERNSADGSVVQKARRQVEVFQSQGVGGRSFQIVRASQWSSSRVTDSTGPLSVPPGEVHQKTDFSESPNGKSDLWRLNGDDSNLSKLSQVSWLCRRLHNDTVKDRASSVTRQNPSPSSIRRSKKFDTKELRRSPNLLSHKKSTSNEDVTNVPEITNSEPLSSFTRGCQSRRSLQVQNSLSTSPPKPTDQTSRRQNSLEDIRRTESSKTTQNSTSSTREIYSKVEQGRKQSLARSEVRDSFRESNEGLKKNPSKLKSYVLGMENQSSLSGNYSSPSSNSGRLPVLTFRGPSECRDHEMKKDEYDYPKSISVATTLPKTIQLVPTSKANTTVVHLTHDTSVHAEIPCLRQNSIPLQSTIKMIPYNPPDSTDFSKNVPRSENPVEKNLSPDRGSSTTETSTAFPGKPAKKVGFCKTEVHFAADSGKVNIVETDGKPPPSNRFRRKRRNTLVNGNVNGNVNKNLPLIHFGDTSYEKYIFGGTGNPQGEKVPLEEAGLGARNLDREVRKKIDDGVGRGVNLKSILEPGFKDDKNFEYGSLKSCFTGDEKTVVQKHRGHTTTVNLGASVLPRLEEGRYNHLRTRIQLHFDIRQNHSHPISDPNRILLSDLNTLNDLENCSRKITSTVSRISRSLTNSDQLALKSTQLIMNVRRENESSSDVDWNGSQSSLDTSEDPLLLKELFPGLRSTRRRVFRNGTSLDVANKAFSERLPTGGDNSSGPASLPPGNQEDEERSKKMSKPRYLPLEGSKWKNPGYVPSSGSMSLPFENPRCRDAVENNPSLEYSLLRRSGYAGLVEEVEKGIGDLERSRDVEIQEVDADVREFSLHAGRIPEGTKRSGNKGSRNAGERNFLPLPLIPSKDSSESFIVKKKDNGTLIEETNSKAEKVPERIQSPDLPRKLRPGSGTVLEDILDPREESKVITSDTENNQVLVKMVTIHKPVIARVENDHSPKMEKRTSESLSSNFAKREGRSRSGSRSRSRSSSCSKDRSGALPAGAEDPYHETKEPCDKGGSMGRQGETGRNEEEPLYANIFEMSGRATPIYENCQIPGNDTEVEEKPTSRNLVEVSLETLKRDTEEALEAISDLSEASSSGSKSRKNSEKPKIGRKKLDVISETNTQALRNEEKNSKPKVKVVKARSKNLGTVSSTSSVESLSRAQEQKTHARISRNPDSKTSSVNSSPRFNRLGENCNVCGSCRVNGRAERGSRGSLDKDPSKTRAKINGSNRQVSTVNGDGAEKQAPSGSIKSKKPIEIVYETAVFNMKNEKLSKPTKAKESKSPRYINDLICGSRNKSSTDRKRVKAVAAAPHAGGKGATQPSRHWK